MMVIRNTIERAFQLAQSGGVRTVDDLRRELKREGYESVEAHLAGASIRKQLTQILAEAAEQPVPAKAEA